MFSYVAPITGHTCDEGECVDCLTEMGECCEHCPQFISFARGIHF